MNILITGGASGLGRSVVERLAGTNKHKVWFTFWSSNEGAEELQKSFKNTFPIKCDFTNPDNLEEIKKTLIDIELDVLVINAHTKFNRNHFNKLNLKDFQNGFSYNILPAISLAQVAIGVFRKKRFGKIITVLSSSILNKPPIGWSHYVAQKAYMYSLVKSWAVENASFNITSNAVSPGFMQTRLTNETDERIIEQMQLNHPLKRLLSTSEVAQAVDFIVHASQHLNGTNIVINAAENVI